MSAARDDMRGRADRARLPWAVLMRVFMPFALGYFLSYVFRTVNSVIAPELVRSTGVNASGLGFLTAAFFLAFAAFQLPLGLLLDRFGPRRVQFVLLLVAACGALTFGLAPGLAGLTVGRALIGLGVSGCMMAGFKAFALWFPPGRLPLVNAAMMAAGATGALAATGPVEWAVQRLDWRLLFLGVTVVTAAVALLTPLVVPSHARRPEHLDLGSQLRGLVRVVRDPFFWRIAPLITASQACFLAVQGLWAGPWLRDVAGLGPAAVGGYLSALSAALVAGFLGSGLVADRLARRGVSPLAVAGTGMGLFLGVTIVLASGWSALPLLLWVAFGLFGTCGTLTYAILSQAFPSELAGRANTALNLLVFVFAFVVQWGIGAVLAWWENPVTHHYGAGGYRLAFGILAGVQAAALLWYLRPVRPGAG